MKPLERTSTDPHRTTCGESIGRGTSAGAMLTKDRADGRAWCSPAEPLPGSAGGPERVRSSSAHRSVPSSAKPSAAGRTSVDACTGGDTSLPSAPRPPASPADVTEVPAARASARRLCPAALSRAPSMGRTRRSSLGRSASDPRQSPDAALCTLRRDLLCLLAATLAFPSAVSPVTPLPPSTASASVTISAPVPKALARRRSAITDSSNRRPRRVKQARLAARAIRQAAAKRASASHGSQTPLGEPLLLSAAWLGRAGRRATPPRPSPAEPRPTATTFSTSTHAAPTARSPCRAASTAAPPLALIRATASEYRFAAGASTPSAASARRAAAMRLRDAMAS
mmetsp:Transcript_36/g.88  ORF Transcript_36/g.88 Transcript_36/m.88 type:complete len:340 (-) Transcript_36:328-1347(-)